ncbi:MAG TPA: 6,7-dimethyl-8-ribityllumazine synthase [Candidatus Krumholzibacteria bacterium]|jgi:6,7-dimethyl-8-ribityllumazine synthase|nr:6,7-dimethyl-8-ribityllumazine synthase [Candidatus Krumholzibacteria bacterium]
MARVLEGQYHGKGKRFGVVVGRFNALFGEKLLDGCLDGLRRHGVADDDVDVAWVPGAWEIPLTCRRMARTGNYDAVIALGVVVRGGTPHFEHVATAVSRGVAEVGLSEDVPVIFGVLTTDSLEQAMERSGTKAGNKGFDAAMAALETADVLSRIEPKS